MSSLEKQLSGFRSSLNASSNKFTKRVITAPTASPSPGPSSQNSGAAAQDAQRRRPDQNVVFSQPADTGTGVNFGTQVFYAVEYLKEKNRALPLEDLLSYLSLTAREIPVQKAFEHLLQRNERVIHDPNGMDGRGSYAFRPKHDIRSGDQLLAALQKQNTFKGLEVKELRDGWPTADETISQLEGEHKLLVMRNRKDESAKHVWPNDPTLFLHIDQEFKDYWPQIRLPDPEQVVTELERAGLTPANKAKKEAVKRKAPEKKQKKRRAGGKTTNSHMKDLLRDYSHLKR